MDIIYVLVACAPSKGDNSLMCGRRKQDIEVCSLTLSRGQLLGSGSI